MFAFPWTQDDKEKSKVSAASDTASVLSTDLAPIPSAFTIKLRSVSEFERVFPLTKLPKLAKLKRLTTIEKQRRQLAETYKVLLTKPGTHQTQMQSFFGSTNDCDKGFLNMPMSKNVRRSGEEVWEGSVAFATDRRHWVEAFLLLSLTEVLICKAADAKKVVLKFPMSSVLSARAMTSDEVPMDGFSFFLIETFSRVHYFMVKGNRQLEGWLQVLANAKITKRTVIQEGAGNVIEDIYFGKSTAWRFEKKRLLNYRNIYFRPQGLPIGIRTISAAQLAEGLLEKVFCLLQTDGTADAYQWIEFMTWYN